MGFAALNPSFGFYWFDIAPSHTLECSRNVLDIGLWFDYIVRTARLAGVTAENQREGVLA
jgi:hypothetical protein